MILGHWIWRNGGRCEDLQLAYLLPVAVACGFPWEGSARVGGWDKATSRERVFRRGRSVGLHRQETRDQVGGGC